MADDVFYFAYGSNLDADRKECRTGTIREARRARLSGFRLAFNKWSSTQGVCANIVPETGATVWGVVYRCTPSTLDRMDVHEGVEHGHYVRYGHYVRCCVRVKLDDGQELEATTYVAGPAYVGPEDQPNAAYLNLIIRGAEARQLPEDYVAGVLALARPDTSKSAAEAGHEPDHRPPR